VVHQRQGRVVDAGEHHPSHTRRLRGHDQRRAEFSGIGREGRDDQKNPLDPVERGSHAVGITKITCDGLVHPGVC